MQQGSRFCYPWKTANLSIWVSKEDDTGQHEPGRRRQRLQTCQLVTLRPTTRIQRLRRRRWWTRGCNFSRRAQSAQGEQNLGRRSTETLIRRKESKLSLQESLQRRREEEGVEVESPCKSHRNDDNEETKRELQPCAATMSRGKVRQFTMIGR